MGNRRRRRGDPWSQAAGGVAQAMQLLKRYDFDPERPPSLSPNPALESDWQRVLKGLD